MKFRKYIYQFFLDLFIVSLAVILLSFIFEGLKKGIIVRHISLSYAELVAMASGLVVLCLPESESSRRSAVTAYMLAVGVGLIVGIHVYASTKELGWWSWLFSVGTGVLVVLPAVFLTHSPKSDQS